MFGSRATQGGLKESSILSPEEVGKPTSFFSLINNSIFAFLHFPGSFGSKLSRSLNMVFSPCSAVKSGRAGLAVLELLITGYVFFIFNSLVCLHSNYLLPCQWWKLGPTTK